MSNFAAGKTNQKNMRHNPNNHFLRLAVLAALCLSAATATWAVELTRCTIVVSKRESPLVRKLAGVLADDIERVSGRRPAVADKAKGGETVTLATYGGQESFPAQTTTYGGQEGGLAWECYRISSGEGRLTIVGSDARGLAYGVFHVSRAIGVSPWYWFADVTPRHRDTLPYAENYTSREPSVKYRGLFINDEDWGMKPWAAKTHERELGDIGPKTYDRVAELILRLGGNMLAPAMHGCTGAFYSHLESQRAVAAWGIMITTSHCEPLLFNNASKSEWDKTRDGEWHYQKNARTILGKLDRRISETRQYDNIYTMGMRGLHDAAMQGSKDPTERARTLEQVFEAQRGILTKYKKQRAEDIPQIFVPYKETLDIYDAGLRVPDDITLVWPDDNYGYMKRVSNVEERKRTGGSGVYYHLSYLGTPHDNLWIATTPPALMYEELRKAYDAGARQYWLLNAGDIKPMEIEVSHFFDMAFDFPAHSYDNANRWQAQLLAETFGGDAAAYQRLLDTYYRLAWDRKPEFMGYEMEWDSRENSRLHDTGFSTADGTWQRRVADCEAMSRTVEAMEAAVSEPLRPAFFEMLGYSVRSAAQMNLKFLYAQLNHETGSREAERLSRQAADSIQTLLTEYNEQLGGKWRSMMSKVPPGYTAKYHLLPEYVSAPTTAFRLPADQRRTVYAHGVDLATVSATAPFRLIEGLGTDWKALQMGGPLTLDKGSIDIPINIETLGGDTLSVCVSVLPMWPVAKGGGNALAVSIDGGEPIKCENHFEEWGPGWKRQVLENRKDYLLRFPVDRSRRRHTLTLHIIDPGQIVQKITFE